MELQSTVSRRERRSAELRERLFRSAMGLFAKKGFAETTVEDITEAADVGKGTFFNYFPSKEHILMSFGEMQLAKLEAVVREAEQSDLPMLEVLHALVLRMTEEPIRNPAMVRALLQANLSSVPVRGEMLRIHERNRALIARLIHHGQERGEVRTDMPAQEIAEVWRQTVFGTLMFWSLVGDGTLTARIERAVRLLWEGIGVSSRKSDKKDAQVPRR
ncbi:MAG TPA: TetR family transcriptional regulator [Candidatus Acidoferrum sp.]|nr:TetR family transcriptional regulator [Candidatus Acidoferrum sp.]